MLFSKETALELTALALFGFVFYQYGWIEGAEKSRKMLLSVIENAADSHRKK